MNTPSSRTRWKLSRPATLVLAAGLVSGAAFAAATGISSASSTATAEAATTPAGYWSGAGGTWSGLRLGVKALGWAAVWIEAAERPTAAT